MLPYLKPTLARLWRSPGTLQIGTHPRRARAVHGLPEGAAPLIAALDGRHGLSEILRLGRRLGVSRACVHQIIALLAAAGLLDDAHRRPAGLPPDELARLAPEIAAVAVALRTGDGGASVIGRRRGRMVRIYGGGRLGAAIATTLAASGVGHIAVRASGETTHADVGPGAAGWSDVGRPRSDTVRDAVLRAGPRTRVHDDGVPDLAVLASSGYVDPLLGAELVAEGVPHLAVAVREAVGIVGPLVLPGGSSCLGCMHAVRTDRDPAWPKLHEQLLDGSEDGSAAALVAATAAQAATQALGQLDGFASAAVGGTLEVVWPDWRWERRSWPRHPACGCARRRPRVRGGPPRLEPSAPPADP
ncbi:thiamine biosynthesis protein ThiF [Allonocardiopsis opalescens]|uniref:Molybdopterin/thiamine biosynthesis adenylyltransferase n=1 Tax=Allonocardiopsis opalescens TaxID=1144618 RepID=A0A2T0QDN4_9ACTN|nr:thiamine biosynthesis protein ThiF [Allonocardiopsis opalescens]PRY02025.1 molybdopterin/thiamine biosynthesis adenylyltransferase [Allonocardiopsis opalescens]